MSGPTKAGEPSMEEILASIRKIIADDPSKAPAAAAGPVSKLPATPIPELKIPGNDAVAAPTTARVIQSGQGSNPSFGRLSEALRTTFATAPEPSNSPASFAGTRFNQSASPAALQPTAPREPDGPSIAVFGGSSERSRSIENELDDILNEPLAEGKPAPADLSAKSEESGGAPSGQWAVWRTSSSKPGGSAEADAPKLEAPASEKPAVASVGSALPPPALGRPSSGFYPANGTHGAASGAAAEPALGGSARREPTLPTGDPSRTSGLGSFIPGRNANSDVGGASAGPARGEPSVSEAPATSDASAGLPARPSKPVVIAAMPSLSAAPPSAPDRITGPAPMVPTEPEANPPAASPAASVSVPLPPRATLFSRPFSASDAPPPASPVIPPADRTRTAAGPVPTPAVDLPVRPTARPAPPAATIPHSALDALAAGLAASNVSAVTTTATVPPVAGAASGPRTLEDSVADMIKPMLQKWIDDNMPRIIEKALRSETGGGGKSGT